MITACAPEISCDVRRRHDFVLLFDVTNGNPNGDPDADNLPRIDPETMHGLVSDVALKRRVRNYLQLVHGLPIFIQSRVSLNTLIVKAFRDIGVQPPQVTLDDEDLVAWFEENGPDGFTIEDGVLTYGGDSVRQRDIQAALLEALEDTPDRSDLRPKLATVARNLATAAERQRISTKDRVNARDRLCRDYYDIRMFGAVLSTGLNAGQVRGPMQLTFARSLDPVIPQNLTITRQARTTAQRMTTGSTEMGRKPIVLYGLYRAHGFFSPKLAETTGVTNADLQVFWEALSNMFEFDRSAARGEMVCRGLYVFSHQSPLGNAPAHRLFDRIVVQRYEEVEVPRQFRDYRVAVDDRDLPAGVSLTRLVA